jgi:hypothetical protein
MSETITVYDGTEVEAVVLDQLSGGGARVEIDEQGGPRWRLDVNSTGSDYDIVTSWNAADELADVDPRDWIDDLIMRLARA